MIFQLIAVLACVSTVTGNQGPYGNYPPQYGQPNPYGQQRQQNPNQPPPQQYGQYQQQPPPQQQGRGQAAYGQLTPYGRGPPPPQNEGGAGGLFSKLKSSIIAAGNAITGGPDNYNAQPPPSQQRRPPPPGAQYGNMPPPPPGYSKPPQDMRGPPTDPYGRPTITHGPPPSKENDGSGGVGGGIFSKLKNILTGDEGMDSPPPSRYPPRGGPPGGGPQGGRYGSSGGYPPKPGGYGGPSPQQGGRPPQPPVDDIYTRERNQNQPPSGFRPQGPNSGFGPGGPNTGTGSDRYYGQDGLNTPPPPPPASGVFGEGPLSDFPPSPYGGNDDPFRPQQQQQQQTMPPMPDMNYPPSPGQGYDMPPPPPLSGQSTGYPPIPPTGQTGYGYPPSSGSGSTAVLYEQVPPVVVEPEIVYPAEPQIFVMDDCIVMIPKPKQFYRKKAEIIRGGPDQLQVFTDFEHVMTKFKLDDGERSYSTGDILEYSPAILPQAQNSLRALANEYETANIEMDDTSLEEFTSRTQQIIAREGSLHYSVIPPLTRDYISKLGLRDGWKDVLSGLALKNVPTFLFSSGYGDIVQQSLFQGGIGEHGMLPQNLRIISNFLKAGPDGCVRAFSQPIVHEKNKNATTAGRFMGFPVPERPYAIVLGSTEDDVKMTENVQGVKDTLSIGYLEMSEDVLSRLTSYLSSYDAIVFNDSSMSFVKNFMEEVLNIPASSTQSSNRGGGGRGQQQQQQQKQNRPSIFDRGIDFFGN